MARVVKDEKEEGEQKGVWTVVRQEDFVDDLGRSCLYTDDAKVNPNVCQAVVVEEWKESCVTRQCRLPIVRRVPAVGKDIPLCASHLLVLARLEHVPIWNGPMGKEDQVTRVRVSQPPRLPAQLRLLYEQRWVKDMESERMLQHMAATLSRVLERGGAEVATHTRTSSELQREMETVRQQLTKCTQREQDAERRHQELERQWLDLKRERKEILDEMERVKQESERDRARLQKQQALVESRLKEGEGRARIRELEQQLVEREQHALEEKATLRAEQREVETKLIENQRAQEELRKTLVAHQRSSEECERHLLDIRSEKKAVDQQLDECRQHTRRLEQELAQAHRELASLQSRNRSLEMKHGQITAITEGIGTTRSLLKSKLSTDRG